MDEIDLQSYLTDKFKSWQPSAPQVVSRHKGDITLDCRQREPFGFLRDHLLYRVEKNNKIPKWIVVYSGGKSTKRIDNLEPRHPHRFRLKVILKATAVSQLADMALAHYGDKNSIFEIFEQMDEETDSESNDNTNVHNVPDTHNDSNQKTEDNFQNIHTDNNIQNEDRKDCGDEKSEEHSDVVTKPKQRVKIDLKKICEAVKLLNVLKTKVDGSGDKNNRYERAKWLESQWSDETWTNTDTDGTSPVLFCMAIKSGYLKQVQVMLDEKPSLLGIVNSSSGFTPLATAVRKGDINTVRFLLTLGAEVDQPSLAAQTPLHLAVLAGSVPIVELLMEKGADFKVLGGGVAVVSTSNTMARDCNGLRVEHYAVDSCDLDMLRYILDKGGDVAVRDHNGWTPLFRALCQGAKTAIVEELVTRGSDLNAVDNAGLPLTSVAKLLKNRHGRGRDSILRLVDSNYPHEKALANFTRLTKKIYNVHALLRIK